MMATWLHNHLHQRQMQELSTEEQLALLRRDLEELDRRIDFIEATIAALRAADEAEPEGEFP